jgi:hypothetical protein
MEIIQEPKFKVGDKVCVTQNYIDFYRIKNPHEKGLWGEIAKVTVCQGKKIFCACNVNTIMGEINLGQDWLTHGDIATVLNYKFHGELERLKDD